MAWDRGLHPGELSHSSPLTNVEGSPTRITQIACFQRLAPPPARQTGHWSTIQCTIVAYSREKSSPRAPMRRGALERPHV